MPRAWTTIKPCKYYATIPNQEATHLDVFCLLELKFEGNESQKLKTELWKDAYKASSTYNHATHEVGINSGGVCIIIVLHLNRSCWKDSKRETLES